MNEQADQEPRAWGPWSVWKTEILLAAYLPLFTTASKKALHRTFIDCFAGSTRNIERGTGREIKSSPQLALEADPQFTHLLLFEKAELAASLERSLREEHRGRALRVLGGDCNSEIDRGLQWLQEQADGNRGPHLGPVLAYLDPDALQLSWRTIETIASWGMTKGQFDGFTRRNRVEQLILFPTGPLRRTLPQPPVSAADDRRLAEIDSLFGTQSWRNIYEAQRDGVISGEDSWLSYVHEYRLGLTKLGYKYTSAIEVRNTKNVVLYHLVFATSNLAGQRIMGAVQDRARQVLPVMIAAEKRRRQSGASRLFDEDEVELDLIAKDPARWARLFDEAPKPFDRNQLHQRSQAKQLGLEL